MLALSLKEPWLQLILDGRKTLETRSWKRQVDEWVLLVSSLKLDVGAMRVEGPYDACDGEAAMRRKWKHPLGHARAVVYLRGARLGRGMSDDDRRACCPTAGRWLYTVVRVLPVSPTFAVRGQLGFFEVDVKGHVTVGAEGFPASGSVELFR